MLDDWSSAFRDDARPPEFQSLAWVPDSFYKHSASASSGGGVGGGGDRALMAIQAAERRRGVGNTKKSTLQPTPKIKGSSVSSPRRPLVDTSSFEGCPV